MALRPYQQQAIEDLRSLFRKGLRRILYQLSTGGGKTHVFAEITRLAHEKNLRVWILVPRKKLLRQASKTLTEGGIPHGRINAAQKESRAFAVHAVSQPTLMRRIKSNKIKNWPDIIVVDEAHLSLNQQIQIKEAAPENIIMIGVTGTPKETSGRGLSELYQDIILGPKHSELVGDGYLSPFKYFCPPFDFKIKKKGDDYDPKTMEDILESRQIYGKVINHYKELALGLRTLIFSPSVKNAEETAQRFRDHGYKFESLDGSMSEGKIEMIITALEEGGIDGICSCDLITFGVDIKYLECIILLRKTMSLTQYFQMLGRGTRPLGKEFCIVLDHMGNFRDHAVGIGETISEKFDVDWRKHFYGGEKNQRPKGEVVASLKLCNSCFMYYSGAGSCPHCGVGRDEKKPAGYTEIDGRLIEVKGPIAFYDREVVERRQIQEKIDGLISRLKIELTDAGLAELLKQAEERGWNAMKIYWELSAGMLAVNVPLLHSIQRLRGYKTGWVWMQTKTIEKRLGR